MRDERFVVMMDMAASELLTSGKTGFAVTWGGTIYRLQVTSTPRRMDHSSRWLIAAPDFHGSMFSVDLHPHENYVAEKMRMRPGDAKPVADALTGLHEAVMRRTDEDDL